MTELKAGDRAPDFDLPGDGGRSIALAAHQGRALVLYFYPKDDTTACTTEAISFSRLLSEFEKAGASVVGISTDSVKKHDNFIRKRELTVALGSDEDMQVSKLYGVWKEKSMYGRTYMGIERSTFLIDREGKIAKIWPKVRVAGHAEEVLEAVRSL